jgi:anthranilate/para-aminobenzoate synthase component II
MYRQMQYLTPTTVKAKVLASDLVKAGKATLTVVSPGPGGGESEAATFGDG